MKSHLFLGGSLRFPGFSFCGGDPGLCRLVASQFCPLPRLSAHRHRGRDSTNVLHNTTSSACLHRDSTLQYALHTMQRVEFVDTPRDFSQLIVRFQPAYSPASAAQ
jgi:hypothetical protein